MFWYVFKHILKEDISLKISGYDSNSDFLCKFAEQSVIYL